MAKLVILNWVGVASSETDDVIGRLCLVNVTGNGERVAYVRRGCEAGWTILGAFGEGADEEVRIEPARPVTWIRP